MAGKHAVALAAALLSALLLSAPALAGNGGIAPPDPASDSASGIRDVYWIVFAICAVIFVAVETVLVLFVVRYRRRRGVPYDEDAPQVHEHRRLELAWTAIPVLIVIAIAIVAIVKVPGIQASPDAGEDALRVRVEAHQFYWQYVYPNGAIAVDRLRLPAERTVTLELTSFDVAHSWWVPELAGKRDAIPGRVNTLSFAPSRPGLYEGTCAEFCGIQHAVMATEVEVVGAAEFDQWVAGEAEAQQGAESELGRATYEAACAKCHGPEGEGDIGPPIQGKIADVQALRPLVTEGQDTAAAEGYMPPVGLGWPDHQLEAVAAYLKENVSGGG